MSRLALRCLISGQGGFLLPVLASSALGAALKLPSFQWHCLLSSLHRVGYYGVTYFSQRVAPGLSVR